MMLTFGTGIGSAIFVDGRLLPNTEFGHMEIRGMEAEHRASARVRTVEQLGWQEWTERVNEVLQRLHALLWPDLFIIGGGVIEHWDQFGHMLESRARIAPARLGNTAGIVGAALAADDGDILYFRKGTFSSLLDRVLAAFVAEIPRALTLGRGK